MNPALLASKTANYRTPEEVLTLVRELESIGLDPCASAGGTTEATVEWQDGGLDRPWCSHGLVFVNPPYGAAVAAWAQKIVAEARQGAEIVALLAARTDTRWFQDTLAPAMDAVCFWRGRLTFAGTAHPAPFPSVLFYAGAQPERFARIFTPHGLVVNLQ